ncbi:MAG: hypothetical protein AAF614_25745 [Chloroflexota bacterium]
MNGAYSRRQLRELQQKMQQVFDGENLRDLCQDLGIGYEDLAGERLGSRIRDLIMYCERHGRLHELVYWAKKINIQAVVGIPILEPRIDEVIATLNLVVTNLAPSAQRKALQPCLEDLGSQLKKGAAFDDAEAATLVGEILDLAPDLKRDIAILFNGPPLVEIVGKKTKDRFGNW